jgi:lysophospholipase L1-like esterase
MPIPKVETRISLRQTTSVRHFVLFAAACTALMAQTPTPAVEDTPGLPRVLLIGDSISIGYTLPVRKLLTGKANVHRINGNAGPTSNGVFLIDTWLGKDKWDVIHFNFGLHDLKRLDDGKQQIPLDSYERYLRLIVQRLKRTGARLIWASTTPVPEGKVSPPRVPADVVAYNAVAARIMKQNDIAVDDLYSFALPVLTEIQGHVNVHFTPAGSERIAKEVAGVIERALAK